MKGGFSNKDIAHGSSSDKPSSQPIYTPTKQKEAVVDKDKLKLANSLFQQVINPAPKFKGPEIKKKNPEPVSTTKPAAPVKQPVPTNSTKPAKKIETTELLDLL